MKSLTLAIVLTAWGLAATLLGDNHHQAGAAASGRASTSTSRLESILGQSVNGFSGDIVSGFLAIAATPAYVPGDANGDGTLDISDIIFIIQYIFGGGPAPAPAIRADADCSGAIDISDAVYLVYYIFNGGSAPHYCG